MRICRTPSRDCIRCLVTKKRYPHEEDTVALVFQITEESGFARFPASLQKAQRNESRTQEQQRAAAVRHTRRRWGAGLGRPLFETVVAVESRVISIQTEAGNQIE